MKLRAIIDTQLVNGLNIIAKFYSSNKILTCALAAVKENENCFAIKEDLERIRRKCSDANVTFKSDKFYIFQRSHSIRYIPNTRDVRYVRRLIIA